AVRPARDGAEERVPALRARARHHRFGDLGADLVGAREAGLLAVAEIATEAHLVLREPLHRAHAGDEEAELLELADVGGVGARGRVPLGVRSRGVGLAG